MPFSQNVLHVFVLLYLTFTPYVMKNFVQLKKPLHQLDGKSTASFPQDCSGSLTLLTSQILYSINNEKFHQGCENIPYFPIFPPFSQGNTVPWTRVPWLFCYKCSLLKKFPKLSTAILCPVLHTYPSSPACNHFTTCGIIKSYLKNADILVSAVKYLQTMQNLCLKDPFCTPRT